VLTDVIRCYIIHSQQYLTEEKMFEDNFYKIFENCCINDLTDRPANESEETNLYESDPDDLRDLDLFYELQEEINNEEFSN